MEKAWVTKSTYELDNSEGHLWISFPSSDRNKISEEDYIILKKKIGTGEEQVGFENKFKVIDIKNEAPDAIKYQLVNYGFIDSSILSATGTTLTEIFNTTSQRLDVETDTLRIKIESWEDTFSIPLHEGMATEADIFDAKDLYISWRRLDANGFGVSSKKYKITGGRITSTYILKLSTKITKIDADIAHLNGTSEYGPETLLHPNLIVQIEKKELKDTENFSGKFFVKISKNQITDLIESGQPTSLLDQYEISSKISSFYWEDDVRSSHITNSGSYGLTNFYGYEQDSSSVNSIQHADNNSVGNVTATGSTLRMTDWAGAWAGIKSNFGSTFFIDSMHVASGQSDASNYAKYNCILWSGCTQEDDGVTAEDSAWMET